MDGWVVTIFFLLLLLLLLLLLNLEFEGCWSSFLRAGRLQFGVEPLVFITLDLEFLHGGEIFSLLIHQLNKMYVCIYSACVKIFNKIKSKAQSVYCNVYLRSDAPLSAPPLERSSAPRCFLAVAASPADIHIHACIHISMNVSEQFSYGIMYGMRCTTVVNNNLCHRVNKLIG